jgi:DNA protecting protein DprA
MCANAITARDIIALSLVGGAGRKTLLSAIRLARREERGLQDYFGEAPQDLLPRCGQGDSGVARALSACGPANVERADYLLRLAEEHEIQHWTRLESAYPPFLLKALGDQAPPVLFFHGNESLLQDSGAAIVGTRRPSIEGREWAQKSAVLFAENGVTVFSGGAAGIDTEAHEAALRADGTTVVVLPEGLHAHHPSPAVRRGLSNGQVMLASEFLPTDAWATPQAITRNRTIAACGRLSCVIEPGKKGGSMYTAEQTLAQGKPVFYWGGACRDGFLRNERNAHPLGERYGNLHREALLNALCPTPPPPSQGDFFDDDVD